VTERPTRYHSYRLGWVLARQGDFTRAGETLVEASARYPDAWEFPFLLAYVYGKTEQEAAAIKSLEQVERRKSDVPEVADVLARLRERRKGEGN